MILSLRCALKASGPEADLQSEPEDKVPNAK